MTQQCKQRGFTIMEILVVIAIIGILASVVLSQVQKARSRGADAAVKSNLTNARPQAALFQEQNSGLFDDVCADAGGIGSMIVQADVANGDGAYTCIVSFDGKAWAAEAQLVTDPALFFCVDSENNATTTSATSALDDTSAVCDGT
jgi:prepilin-type N-terminal cleavage/methylation domain-containing protein